MSERLGYRPALDGWRGLAVLAVMAFHAERWLDGGRLGGHPSSSRPCDDAGVRWSSWAASPMGCDLWHVPVFALCATWFDVRGVRLVVIEVAAAFAVAVASYYLVERRFLALKRRREPVLIPSC